MKRLLIVSSLVMVFAVGTAHAQQYEVAPAGGKNFITAVGIPPDTTISLDIWLTGVPVVFPPQGPQPQNAGCAWLDFTGSTDDISYVSGGRCLEDGSEGCTGPWTPEAGVLVNEPAGVGTIFYIVANLAGAVPDSDGDLIVGTVTLQNTGPNDATVDINTSASSCWTPISNIDVDSGQIVISQILDDEDEDGIQDDQDNCPNMPNGPLLGTCINIFNGVVGTTCLNDSECGIWENCSNSQEDRDNNGSGDTCDTVTFCRGLADFDSDVDSQDVTAFLHHFGRSQYNNPCPPDGPTPVCKTGQTTSYATGDDGDHQRGVALVTPRFTDNGNGTVTDNQTGLIWMKDANCFGQKLWNEALLDCNGLSAGWCGLTDGSSPGDWRFPNINELASLVHKKYYLPAMPDTLGIGHWSEGDPFTNVQSNNYWSSSSDAYNSERAWHVGMSYGVVINFFKTSYYYVWCVRGGR